MNRQRRNPQGNRRKSPMFVIMALIFRARQHISTTHLGNSLISYYPSLTATLPIIGSIQKITTNRSSTQLVVKPQGPCPPNIYDPFIQYPWFPARIYSSKMLDREDHIPINSVLSHVVRFEVAPDRVVILTLSRVSLSIKFLSISTHYF